MNSDDTIILKRAVLEQTLEAIELHLRNHERGCAYLDGIPNILRAALKQQKPVFGTVYFRDNHQYRSQLRFPIADGAYDLVKIENQDTSDPLFHVTAETWVFE